MDKRMRLKMVKAMEFIACHINDESILESWRAVGVADGDIQYATSTSIEDLENYFDDDRIFADLMDTFLGCMQQASLFGGLYCDGVVSRELDPMEAE